MRRKRPADQTKSFEAALRNRAPAKRYLLRLFVTGATPRSVRAIQNIRAVCEEQLQGRYDLEVIDIYQNPEKAKPQQIVVAPTLVKELPLPVRRLIGDLTDKERVLIGLDIVPRGVTGKPLEEDRAT